MTINTNQILNAVTVLAEEKNLRATVKETFKGGCIAGAGAMIGGLMLGPPGLAIGGIIGSCCAAVASANKFKPVAHVIMYDMSPSQKDRLAVAVETVIHDFKVEDLTALLPLLLNNQSLQAAVLKQVAAFVQNEMKMQIID